MLVASKSPSSDYESLSSVKAHRRTVTYPDGDNALRVCGEIEGGYCWNFAVFITIKFRTSNNQRLESAG